MSLRVWQLDPANLTPYYDRALCDALARAGCEVKMITSRFIYDQHFEYPDTFETDYHYFKFIDHKWIQSNPLLRRIFRGVSYPLEHQLLLKKIRQEMPDIVHIQWSRLPRFDIGLIEAIKDLGIPVVHTVHDVEPLFQINDKVNLLEKTWASASALIAHNQYTVDVIRQKYPQIDPNLIHVIPHLMLDSAESISSEASIKARQILGIDENVPVIRFLGTIKPYKALDVLMFAFEFALEKIPDLHLLVAGQPESSEMSLLLKQIARHPNTIVHDGFVADSQVWLYYAAADLAVFPYRHITQSGAVIKTMASGLPVIVTRVGGLPELVGDTGWIVEPDNPRMLADQIISALSNRQQLKEQGKRGQALIKSNYAPQKIAEQHVSLYESLLP